MNRCLFVLALSLLGLVGCRGPEPGRSGLSEAVRLQVRQELDVFSQLSGQSDLQGVLARFDDEADILLVGSDAREVFKGRAAMEAWLGKLYTYSGFSWKPDRVEISGHGDTAWAFVEGKAVVTNRQTGALRFSAPYRYSAVLVRRGNAWKWRLFHGSAPGKE